MTRFARAKGSKSSNERAPEDSTPWEVMKEQLLHSKKEKDEAGKRREAENQRIANYESFLKEHKVSKRKAAWCDFPEEQPKKRLLPQKQPIANESETTSKKNDSNVTSNTKVDMSEKVNKKKKKKKAQSLIDKTTVEPEPTGVEKEPVQGVPDPGKKQKKKNKLKGNSSENSTLDPEPTGVQKEPVHGFPSPGKNQKKKNKKNKLKVNSSENSTHDPAPTPESKDAKFPTNNNNQHHNTEVAATNKKKKPKKGKGKPVRRKEINDNSFQIIINGKPVELVRFDGFPIMKKDAERLAELKQSMIQKGIPKSEVQRTMKLERRRAEKALARVRREVCYNCRKGGHNLSDCPDLKSKIPGVEAADGVCFKCGSTEHRQFECKVQRDKEFRFATCFICREAGHIARQCPDNPKGLYPNGGSCKLCGDVTHLRKDCPTTQGQREETSLKLDTLESADNIEDIGQTVIASNPVEVKKAPKKIKF